MINTENLKIVLNKKNRIYAITLFFLWIIFTAMELVGITSIPIFLSILLESTNSFKIPMLDNFFLIFDGLEKKQIFIYLVGVIITIFLIKNIFFVFLIYFEQLAIKSITVDVKRRAFNYYFRRPFKEQYDSNSSDIIRKVNFDSANAVTYINSSLALFFQLFLTTSITIYLLYVDFFLTLTILIFFILILSTIYLYSSKRLSLYGEIKQKWAGKGIKVINEGMNSIKEVILYNKINLLTGLYSQAQQEQQKILLKINLFKRAPRGIFELLSISFILLVVLFKIFINEESVQSTIVFLTLIVISLARILPSINQISMNFSNIKSTEYSFFLITNCLFELNKLDEMEMKKTDDNLKFKFTKKINFDRVSFGYNDHLKLFDNLSFEIKKNSIIGIFGESGSGKSTILNLLTGLLNPDNGNIFVDEFNLNENKNKDLWQKIIGYIPQDNLLLDETIKKNIIFSNELEILDKLKLEKAINISKIDKFLLSLKDGLDTKIGDRGINISGGQRQRIGIARALYNDPELLIFDESTSSLDLETEKQILNEIYSMKNKTIIMISHNLKTLDRCDKIFKLKNGNLIDTSYEK